MKPLPPAPPSDATALILCGALGREVRALMAAYGWAFDLYAINALYHLHPQRIAPAVEAKIQALQGRYAQLFVLYGDCGTYGALDAVLEKYGVERLPGPHCYAWFGGADFERILAEAPGTFILTDFLVRAFRRAVVKGLGLDRYPELREVYFRHYTHLLYLAQQPNDELLARAQAIADYLQLPLEIRVTGMGALAEGLAART